MRLDKYIADMTDYSRNDVRKLVRDRLVEVNGEIVKDSSMHINENDVVTLNGMAIEYAQFEYYLLYKPAGYLSATNDSFQPTIMELIDSHRKNLSPVGRLDKDSEGAILITNDGKLNHDLLSVNHHVDKKYYVEFEGTLPENAVELFTRPMIFKEFVSLPGKLEVIDDHSAYLTICEGKFHQVKRMFAKVGCEVTYLRRDEFAGLTLEGLQQGQFRRLTDEEVSMLRKVAGQTD